MSYYVFENVPNFSCEFKELRTKFNMLCQHYHTSYEIFLLLDGMRYVFLNNGTYRLRAGDAVIIEPYTLHLFENGESDYFKRYVINFTDKDLNTLFSAAESARFLKGLRTGIVHLDEKGLDHAQSCCKTLSGMENVSDPYSKKLLGIRLISFLDTLKSRDTKGNSGTPDKVTQSSYIARAINYINQHFTENITLDFIVDYSHMSKANFCLVFKKETGSTFLEYINNRRVAYAHSLLIETDMPIQRIAEKTGFSSTLHLDRVFKSIHGTTPRGIRKMNNASNPQ